MATTTSMKPAMVSSFQIQQTSSGQPFIALPVKDPGLPIFLTPLYKTDVEAMTYVLDQPAVNNSLISVPSPYTLKDAYSWLDTVEQPDCKMRNYTIRAQEPETGSFIGSIGYSPYVDSDTDDGFQLGYFLSTDFHGKGIMRNAVAASLYWAAVDGISDVTVKVVVTNTASRAIVEGIDSFKKVEGVEEIDWPEAKGGGKRTILKWRRT